MSLTGFNRLRNTVCAPYNALEQLWFLHTPHFPCNAVSHNNNFKVAVIAAPFIRGFVLADRATRFLLLELFP